MYFLLDGKVQIVNEEGIVLDMISKGGFFGEIGLLKQIARTASVRSGTTSCELLLLSKNTVKSLLKEYPECFQMIALESEKRNLKVEERTVSESLMSSTELGKFVPKASTHTANEFTDGIKVNRKDRVSLSRMFRGKDSSTARELPTLEISSKELNSRQENLSLDSIRHPEPKKGMSIHSDNVSRKETIPTTVADSKPPSHEKSSDIKSDKPKGTFGKIFSSLRSTLTKSFSKSSNKINFLGKTEATDSILIAACIDHILNISDEDMPIIMSRVQPCDLIKLQMVCHKWQALFKKPFMWASIDLRSDFRIVDKNVVNMICAFGNSNIQKIDFSGCWQIVDDDLKTVASCCPNLSVLYLSNCWKISDVGVEYIAKDSKNLKDIDLSYCGQLVCSSLLNHCWTQLEKINFSFCKQIGDEHLEPILSKSSKINSLKFRRCNRVTDFGMFLVGRYCR